MEYIMKKDKTTGVILAAGQGKRMNTPVAKQFLILEDKPVLYYSLKAFEDSSVDEIILVCGKDQVEYCKDNIVKLYGFTKVSQVIEGGDERYDSVYRALQTIDRTNYVIIHDGARPFASSALINQLIDVVRECKACIVATPVKDTIKVVDNKCFIKDTPNRSLLWSAQTPQAFEYSSIKRAYELLFQEDTEIKKKITDDAMVCEMYCKLPIKIVEGNYGNIKITTGEDLVLAKVFLNNQKKTT